MIKRILLASLIVTISLTGCGNSDSMASYSDDEYGSEEEQSQQDSYASREEDDCKRATAEAESSASELSDTGRRLENCASSGDLKDDCYSEMNRVKSAFSDYESDSSEVSSYCR